MTQETIYMMALGRMGLYQNANTLALYKEAGSATEIFNHRNNLKEICQGVSARMAESFKNWDAALAKADSEINFANKQGIAIITYDDERYPQRLKECVDAPLVLYYKGNADLNATRTVAMVGTRNCTPYGQDIIRTFMHDIKSFCPNMVVMSGLAYGVDINAHKECLKNDLQTIGVLAHGLDQIYPYNHRETAGQMINHGGLLTEYMSGTNADKVNFIQRNRIVAGMSDATIVVESANKGGSLITARIARDYNRDVFAFPGNVTNEYSKGCNKMIADNTAALLTSAEDFVKAMGWDADMELIKARNEGIERQLFLDLSEDESTIVNILSKTNDLQINMVVARSAMPVNKVTSILFMLEMKGVVKTYAGGIYHLLK
ncbi:MAG: DNA-processing protein DprA [Prevotellaceae bacterium]|nr:DNA-processing protein DprA [Prevotellaceae bacterium]